MYCICASATCALPSRLLACWAKMSRIRAVRSMTLTLTTSSRLDQLARAELTVADHGVGAGRERRCRAAPGPCRSRCRWPGRACRGAGRRRRAPARPPSRRARPARPASSRRPATVPVGPDADEHDALQAQLAVLDLGDVLELGGEARDTAQRRAVGAVELLAVGEARRTHRRAAPRPRRRGERGCAAPRGAPPARARPRRCRRTGWVSPRSWGRRAPARRRAGSGKVSRSSASRLPRGTPGASIGIPPCASGHGSVRAPSAMSKFSTE